MRLLDSYEKRDYEPLVPGRVDSEQMLFKFNSPTHFISYVEALNELPEHQHGNKSSTDTDDRTTRFTLSNSLPEAFMIVRQTEFDPDKTDILQAKIIELKKNSMFSDEGHEIDIPEYLSGSERTWIERRSKSRPTRLIDETLIVNIAYSSDRDAEKCKRMGIELLTEIYRRNVIPRKMILAFDVVNVNESAYEGYLYSIDVDFRDLNGIAKMMHPSAFRRLWFRLVEIYPNLSWGYGQNPTRNTEKGYISFQDIYESWDVEGFKEKQVDIFLGLQDKS